MSAHPHEHGSLADEAARLVDAFGHLAAGWSREVHDDDAMADGAARPGASPDGSSGATPGQGHPAACRVCPLCQLVARVQESRPDVVSHLVDAASSVAAALAELSPQRGQRPTPGPAREQTEHIDITD